MTAVAALFFLLQGPGPVAAPAGATATFAREALRICVDTAADPQAVRALAHAEKWAPLAPTAVESHGAVATSAGKLSPSVAWSAAKDGLDYTISIYETRGGLLFSSRCDIAAWELDLDAAHAAFTADARIQDRSAAGWPIKQYETQGPRLSIVYAAGERGARVLHTFEAAR